MNPGLPVWWEGAQETWYGARFDWPDDSTSIDDDLAVQKFGGGSNNTHTGRVSDSAGMLFHISTVGYDSVTMSYDWRTFLASGNSDIKVGYYVGDLTGHLEVGLIPDFANFHTEFGVNWWNDAWVQTTSGQSDNWHNVSVDLPAGQTDVWVAFWMDGSNCEYGKFDNVCVNGTQNVPEPSSIFIALIGGALCACVAIRRRSAAQQSGTAPVPRVLGDHCARSSRRRQLDGAVSSGRNSATGSLVAPRRVALPAMFRAPHAGPFLCHGPPAGNHV